MTAQRLSLTDEPSANGGNHDAGYRPQRLSALFPQGNFRIRPVDQKNAARQIPYHRFQSIRPARRVSTWERIWFPTRCAQASSNGTIKNIVVIGHGTAAVAGQAVADALSHYLKGRHLNILARVASELSGFGLNDDGPDTLVIPITQSGTTTDTNRAVAMARERGAHIISIVNRRQSDITAISHGVFYTSDGRDIEMSVASTKAFYAQIVAGQVLALFFAQLLGARTDDDIARQLRRLESVPRLMDQLFARRDDIAASVKKAVGQKILGHCGQRSQQGGSR